jgi:hypothetical protein
MASLLDKMRARRSLPMPADKKSSGPLGKKEAPGPVRVEKLERVAAQLGTKVRAWVGLAENKQKSTKNKSAKAGCWPIFLERERMDKEEEKEEEGVSLFSWPSL